MPEILAPAGNADMLRAAVYAGADAVYLGLHRLNARRTAGNFDAASLKEAAAFCRARNVKTYLTLNTTLTPDEMGEAARAIEAAANAGVDALIVQDLAVAALARDMAPDLPLHGSTQMTIHTAEGAIQAAEMGFSRVILARELSLAEIAAVCAASPIEVEVFIHGALCMSVSGQCYMSAFLGGRSGNRGACAGPCRLPFSAGEPGACHLSLKDHSHIRYLPDLAKAGVHSVKIEGRLRSPEYVAAAVNACIAARSGQPYDEELLQNVFSRSGFTDGYIMGRRDGTMFGVRTGDDVEKAKQAAPKLRELFRRERESVPISLKFMVQPGKAELAVSDEDGHEVAVKLDALTEPAANDPRSAYERALSKTGGTPFCVKHIEVEANGLYLPASQVNAMRRDALEQLLEKRMQTAPVRVFEAPEPALSVRDPQEKHWMARVETPQQLAACLRVSEGLERLVVPVEHWQQVPQAVREKTWLELPRVEFGALEQAVARLVKETRQEGFAGYVVHNLAHLHLVNGAPAMGGFGLNVTNAMSAAEYSLQGLELLTAGLETPCAEMRPIAGECPLACSVYGHIPLMVTRACPLRNVRTCDGCSREGELLDRKNMRFPVRCTGPAGVRTIYNPIALYAADRVKEIPADWMVLHFTIEPPERVEEVVRMALAQRAYDGKMTRGLLFKPREDTGKGSS